MMKVRDLLAGAPLQLRRGDGSAITADARDALLALEAQYEARCAEIDADQRLTDLGRTDAKRQAGREVLASARAWFDRHLTGAQRHERALLEELRAAAAPGKPSDPADRMEAAMLRQEVRRLAAGMDDDTLESLYRRGTAAIRAALEELPRIESKSGVAVLRPFVSDDLREAVLLEVGAAQRPEAADTLHDVRACTTYRSQLIGALEQAVEQVAPGTVEPRAPERL